MDIASVRSERTKVSIVQLLGGSGVFARGASLPRLELHEGHAARRRPFRALRLFVHGQKCHICIEHLAHPVR